MRSRRAATALLLALALTASCLTALDDGTGATPTDTAAENCTPVDRHTVDPDRDSVEPSELPDRPPTWNESSVRAYVVAFEKAYARNGALAETSTRVEVAVTDVSVSTVDGTWVVRLTSRTNTWAQGRPDGNRTATPVHGDGPYVPVVYHLTDSGLYRTEDVDAGSPSASATRTATTERGVAVACFEE